ncbi:GDSL esterase/lipase At1g29670-like [Cicer arietinum]|uniref:GDSL esterase/lipase At1g29670-like n=1 Tax=Cicer arietinum TaxID=3827 RepID=A0A1S2X9Z8_CICAR|nr:GDSL esterase/lipase At1g29670-like [Cicer arietinum]
MACETKIWLVLHFLLLAACCMQHCVHGVSQVPCLFIFGDSLSDTGNNNNLSTSAKPIYHPYGIEHPHGPTGRFSDGYTTIDIIAQLLEFENPIPPFANLSGSDILKGVNYASGSAGIREETGKQLGNNIPLGLQLKNHRIIISQIATKLGGLTQAMQYLNKCLYYVNIGSNDYMNNYFQPQYYSTSRNYTPEQYAEVLVKHLSQYIQDLHGIGARKFALYGVGYVGCSPNSIATRGTNGSCIKQENLDALIFSHKLRDLVDQNNNQYHDSKYIFINSTAIKINSSLGFTVIHAPCCPMRSDGMCIPGSKPCSNRKEYAFYDGFHPTFALNSITASIIYNSTVSPGVTYPINVQQLAQLVIS